MPIVFLSKTPNIEIWKSEIKKLDPSVPLLGPNEISDPSKVIGAMLWHHPHGSLNNYPNLKWVTSLGAGVDHILSDKTINPEITITRIVDIQLEKDMAETALLALLSLKNNLHKYIHQQEKSHWNKIKERTHPVVGILGMGEMGKSIAERLKKDGFTLNGFSRSGKPVPGVKVFSEYEIDSFLKESQALINTLPLTPETENILNYKLFEKASSPTWIINLARGRHLVEEDLLKALDDDLVAAAWLDVFREEPLPKNHAFWNHPKIIVTPHIASITQPSSAAGIVVENYNRILKDRTLLYEIDRIKGY